MIDLQPKHRELLCTILRQHVPDCTVWIFGSRARGSAKIMSDIDLALEGNGAIDQRRISNLREAFDESLLPMKVDIVDLYSIDAGFRNIIERQRIALSSATVKSATK
jgi:predicted nucleotidyltransferase